MILRLDAYARGCGSKRTSSDYILDQGANMITQTLKATHIRSKYIYRHMYVYIWVCIRTYIFLRYHADAPGCGTKRTASHRIFDRGAKMNTHTMTATDIRSKYTYKYIYMYAYMGVYIYILVPTARLQCTLPRLKTRCK